MSVDDDNWHLDKKVPISLILAMLLQGGGFIWYLGQVDRRISLVEAEIVNQHERDKAQDVLAAETTRRVGLALERIDDKIDRLLERRPDSGRRQ
jgi:hypothetical protein